MQTPIQYALAITAHHIAILSRNNGEDWAIAESDEREAHPDQLIDIYFEKLKIAAQDDDVGLFFAPELYVQSENARDDFYAGSLNDEREFYIEREDYEALSAYLQSHKLNITNFGLIENDQILMLTGANGQADEDISEALPRKRVILFLILGILAILCAIWFPLYEKNQSEPTASQRSDPEIQSPEVTASEPEIAPQGESAFYIPKTDLPGEAPEAVEESDPSEAPDNTRPQSASASSDQTRIEPNAPLAPAPFDQRQNMAENFYPPMATPNPKLMVLTNHPLNGVILLNPKSTENIEEADLIQIIEGKPDFLIIARPENHAEPIAPSIGSPPRRNIANLLQPKPISETPSEGESSSAAQASDNEAPSAEPTSEADVDLANDQGNAEQRGPSSGAIAQLATQRDIFSFSDISIIGIYGKTNNLSAVIRRNNGKVTKISSGDKVDGWTVAAISPAQVVLTRANEQKTLSIPR